MASASSCRAWPQGWSWEPPAPPCWGGKNYLPVGDVRKRREGRRGEGGEKRIGKRGRGRYEHFPWTFLSRQVETWSGEHLPTNTSPTLTVITHTDLVVQPSECGEGELLPLRILLRHVDHPILGPHKLLQGGRLLNEENKSLWQQDVLTRNTCMSGWVWSLTHIADATSSRALVQMAACTVCIHTIEDYGPYPLHLPSPSCLPSSWCEHGTHARLGWGTLTPWVAKYPPSQPLATVHAWCYQTGEDGPRDWHVSDYDYYTSKPRSCNYCYHDYSVVTMAAVLLPWLQCCYHGCSTTTMGLQCYFYVTLPSRDQICSQMWGQMGHRRRACTWGDEANI